MKENAGKYLMLCLLLVCVVFNKSLAADMSQTGNFKAAKAESVEKESHVRISGKVKAGSVDNEVHIRINNNSEKTVTGIQAGVLQSPGFVSNFQIEPTEIDFVAPNNSVEFTVHFDVLENAPLEETHTVKFRLSTEMGKLEETEPEMVLTVEEGQTALASLPNFEFPPELSQPAIDDTREAETAYGSIEESIPDPEFKTIVVPDLLGKSEEMATAWLDEIGLRMMEQQGDPAPSPENVGRVSRQKPKPGERIAAGGVVALTFYEEAGVLVPDLIGKSREMTVSWIEELGLQYDFAGEVNPSSASQSGLVASQVPTPGSRVARGSVITVSVYRDYSVQTITGEQAEVDCSRWPGTVAMTDPITGEQTCDCPPGSTWSKVRSRCLSLPGSGDGVVGTGSTSECSHMPGTIYDSMSGTCRCPVGIWNAELRRCVDTAAVERQKEIDGIEKDADCELLYSRIRSFRSSQSSIHRQAAAEAEREARVMGCNEARIADAIAAGGIPGGDGTPSPGTATSDTTTSRIDTSGAVTSDTTASGTGTSGTTASGTTTSGTATSGITTSGTTTSGTGTSGTGASGTGTSGTSGSEPEKVPCECIDEQGRGYAIIFGQFGAGMKCGDEAEAHRNYDCIN